MKVSRVDTGVRVRLGVGETETLTTVIADLVNALREGGLDVTDPVYQRLFPAGYQDNPKAAEAFRSLTETSLRAERLQRAQECLAELAAVAHRRKVDVVLDPDATQRWMTVLNDMRLAIGTRLGIKDDDVIDFDPRDPESMPWAIYAYLTGVQDSLVRAAMR